MDSNKKLVLYLILSTVLCTSCTTIETRTDLQTSQSTSTTLEETTSDMTDVDVTDTDMTSYSYSYSFSHATTADTNITDTMTVTTTDNTSTTSSGTTTAKSTTSVTTTKATTITTTSKKATTTTTTTESVTTTTTEPITETTTTEQPQFDDVQLTPDEMLQEMFGSKANLTLCYVDEYGKEYIKTIDCVEVEYIRMYLYDCIYTSDNPLSEKPTNSYISVSLEFEDLFGNLCCKETLTIYDVSSLNLNDGNCRVDVEIYDPDGSMYHNSSESYITNVRDLDGLFSTALELAQ